MESKSTNESLGRCFLVGAGPGDLGLVTLRAKECIEQADVIVYDHLANTRSVRKKSTCSWSNERAQENKLSG